MGGIMAGLEEAPRSNTDSINPAGLYQRFRRGKLKTIQPHRREGGSQ